MHAYAGEGASARRWLGLETRHNASVNLRRTKRRKSQMINLKKGAQGIKMTMKRKRS